MTIPNLPRSSLLIIFFQFSLFNKGKLRRHNKKIVELNQLNEQIQKLVAELSEAYKPLDENKQVTHGELYQFMTTLIQNSTPHELQNELPNILNLLPNEEIQQFFKQEVSALLGTTDTVGTEDDDDDLDLSELGGIDLYEFAMRDGKEQRAAESKHRFFSSGVSSSSTASNSTNAELAKGSN